MECLFKNECRKFEVHIERFFFMPFPYLSVFMVTRGNSGKKNFFFNRYLDTSVTKIKKSDFLKFQLSNTTLGLPTALVACL